MESINQNMDQSSKSSSESETKVIDDIIRKAAQEHEEKLKRQYPKEDEEIKDDEPSSSSSSSPGYENAFLNFLNKRKDKKISNQKNSQSDVKKLSTEIKKEIKLEDYSVPQQHNVFRNQNLSIQKSNQSYFPVPTEKINCKIITKNPIDRNAIQQKAQYVSQQKDDKDTIKLHYNPQTTVQIRNIVLPKTNSNSGDKSEFLLQFQPIASPSSYNKDKFVSQTQKEQEFSNATVNIVKKDDIAVQKLSVNQNSKQPVYLVNKSQQINTQSQQQHQPPQHNQQQHPSQQYTQQQLQQQRHSQQQHLHKFQEQQQHHQQQQRLNLSTNKQLQNIQLFQQANVKQDVNNLHQSSSKQPQNVQMLVNAQIRNRNSQNTSKTVQHLLLNQQVPTSIQQQMSPNFQQQTSPNVQQQASSNVQQQLTIPHVQNVHNKASNHRAMLNNVQSKVHNSSVVKKESNLNGQHTNQSYFNETNNKKKSHKSSIAKTNVVPTIKFATKLQTCNNHHQRVVLSPGQMPVLTKVEAIDPNLIKEESYAPPVLAPQEIKEKRLDKSNEQPPPLISTQTNEKYETKMNKMFVVNQKYYTVNNYNKSIYNSKERFYPLSLNPIDLGQTNQSLSTYKSPSSLENSNKMNNDFIYLKTDFDTFEKSLQSIEKTDGSATTSTTRLLMMMDSPLSGTSIIKREVNDLIKCDKIETHNLDEVVSDMLVRNISSTSPSIAKTDSERLDFSVDSCSSNSNRIVKNNVTDEATVMPNNNNLSKLNVTEGKTLTLKGSQDESDKNRISNGKIVRRKHSKHNKDKSKSRNNKKKMKLIQQCKIELQDVMQQLDEDDRKKLLANETIQARPEQDKETIKGAEDYKTPQPMKKRTEPPSIRKQVILPNSFEMLYSFSRKLSKKRTEEWKIKEILIFIFYFSVS